MSVEATPRTQVQASSGKPVVGIVDDELLFRQIMRDLLEAEGLEVMDFESARTTLYSAEFNRCECLVVGVRMSDTDGLDLVEAIERRHFGLPIIVLMGNGDISLAARAMKAGAIDLIERPPDEKHMIESVRRALSLGAQMRPRALLVQQAHADWSLLSARERQVFALLIDGKPNKAIAFELGLSARTVEIHRARVMSKMRAANLAELIRLAVVAGIGSMNSI